MAKDGEARWTCPECGNEVVGAAEHRCSGLMVDDPSHEHRFDRDGACACGLDAYKAVRMAAKAQLERDIPAASTACRECDAPITPQQRLASGLCDECMAHEMARVPRPALVLNADALRVCPDCAAVFDSLMVLDRHRSEDHRPGRLDRAKALGRKVNEAALAARAAQEAAELARLNAQLDSAIRGMREVTHLAREALERRGFLAPRKEA